MNILLIGSGGREHALALALSKSPSCDKIYAVPGNPGIFTLAEHAPINIVDYDELHHFCIDKKIELVVVGPEQPLAEGTFDILRTENIKVFGPTKKAARLESSKGFAKEFMKRNNIPTAGFRRFFSQEPEAAHDFINTLHPPVVLKADGLAAGKGVIISETLEDAHEKIDEMFKGLFSEAGKSIVIEEFLEGEEASILAITDGKDFIRLASSQDHKRALDHDKGSNTGGMGAYSPARIVTPILDKVDELVIKPTIEGMAKEGNPFTGCLYVGLMIKDGEPKVVEYNVRFGDPETEAVLLNHEGDFAKLLYSAASGSLDKEAYRRIPDKYACCVILASKGYPDAYSKGFTITGIDKAEVAGAVVFQSGTAIKEGNLVSAGGRVLGVCGSGSSLTEAIEKSYTGVSQIHFDNMYFRKDIGKKGLKHVKH